MRMPLPVRLALRDLRHDWQAAGCFVAAMVGMLAPLLIIFALKNGVITSMVERMVDDPANREIIAVGAGSHRAEFFEVLADDSDVGFLIPATRSINTVANAVRHIPARKLQRNVEVIPTSAGDPLVPEHVIHPGQVAITAPLATELMAAVGDRLQMRIDRRLDDQPQTALRELEVITVLPPETFGRAAMFIALPDLLAIERYRDDKTITAADWTAPRPAPDTYASFRLYSSTLDGVGRIETRLRRMGVQNRPRAENVMQLLSLRRGLDMLFALIAVLALSGFWAAMAANLRGTVERQRVPLSLLRLLGLSEAGRRAIPMIQSVALVACGVVVTVLLVLPVLALINLRFTPEGFDRIAVLGLSHFGWTVIFGLVVAVTAAAWAVISIGDIESDEVLRAV